MCFQAGLICLGVSIYAFYGNLFGPFKILAGISMLLLFGAFVADVRIDHQVSMTLQSSKHQFNEIALKAIRKT
jgi:hypothetical protein